MPAKTEKGSAASGGAVDRTIALLELMALAEEPFKLSDAAHRLGIPKSAAHRILTTLIDNDWARQNSASGCYSLTIRMALLGQRQLEHLKANDLRQPILDDLAGQTRELVRLTAARNHELVWIGSARGRRSGLVYEADMSERIVPFATANGKAWLASLPREEARSFESASSATNVQTSPEPAGESSSTFACFIPTKLQISSTSTRRV